MKANKFDSRVSFNNHMAAAGFKSIGASNATMTYDFENEAGKFLPIRRGLIHGLADDAACKDLVDQIIREVNRPTKPTLVLVKSDQSVPTNEVGDL